MPERSREIFVLGCLEGISYKEIADQLGISVNTVKTQMKVAYTKLKDEYKDGKGNMMSIARLFPVNPRLGYPFSLLKTQHYPYVA